MREQRIAIREILDFYPHLSKLHDLLSPLGFGYTLDELWSEEWSNYRALGAFLTGTTHELIGVLLLHVTQTTQTGGLSHRLSIEAVGVKAEYKEMGIAKVLFHHRGFPWMEQKFCGLPVEGLYMRIPRDSVAAIGLCISSGFRVWGTARKENYGQVYTPLAEDKKASTNQFFKDSFLQPASTSGYQ